MFKEGVLETDLLPCGTATVAVWENDQPTGERLEGVSCWLLLPGERLPAKARVIVGRFGAMHRITEVSHVFKPDCACKVK